MFNFSKALYWLGLVHVLLGAAIEHTKHHNTLTVVDNVIEEIGGLAGSLPGPGEAGSVKQETNPLPTAGSSIPAAAPSVSS